MKMRVFLVCAVAMLLFIYGIFPAVRLHRSRKVVYVLLYLRHFFVRICLGTNYLLGNVVGLLKEYGVCLRSTDIIIININFLAAC